jgi:hypothetical protein
MLADQRLDFAKPIVNLHADGLLSLDTEFDSLLPRSQPGQRLYRVVPALELGCARKYLLQDLASLPSLARLRVRFA